jgi:Tfp pilus assembly protein PilP
MTAEMPPTVHLKLTGIIREAHSYYALVESESSPGVGYVIRENSVIDSAKVVKITKDSVVFAVQTKNSEGKLLTRYVEKHMLSVEPR